MLVANAKLWLAISQSGKILYCLKNDFDTGAERLPNQNAQSHRHTHMHVVLY